MNILVWILFGLIAGFIADAISPSRTPEGIIGTITLGILGSLIGGFLSNLFFRIEMTGFNFTSFILAAIGSLIVLYLRKALVRS